MDTGPEPEQGGPFMGDAPHQHKVIFSLTAVPLALALGFSLAGCGGGEGGGAGVKESPSASHSSPSGPSPSGDWWPKQPETMATGQKIPENYEPASAEHPARNVPKPTFPEAAEHETKAGAQAFLDYRTDAVWYAFQTGDTSLAREVTVTACETCERDFKRIEAVYSQGGWLAGGYEDSDILDGPFKPVIGGIYSLPVKLDSSGVKEMKNGKTVSEQEPFVTDDQFNGNIDFRGGKWNFVTASPRSYQLPTF